MNINRSTLVWIIRGSQDLVWRTRGSQDLQCWSCSRGLHCLTVPKDTEVLSGIWKSHKGAEGGTLFCSILFCVWTIWASTAVFMVWVSGAVQVRNPPGWIPFHPCCFLNQGRCLEKTCTLCSISKCLLLHRTAPPQLSWNTSTFVKLRKKYKPENFKCDYTHQMRKEAFQ